MRDRAVARIIAAEDPGSLRNQFTNFASRSQAIQQAVEEKSARLEAEKSRACGVNVVIPIPRLTE